MISQCAHGNVVSHVIGSGIHSMRELCRDSGAGWGTCVHVPRDFVQVGGGGGGGIVIFLVPVDLI